MKTTHTRQATDKLLELIEDGCVDRDYVIIACLKYMSEAEVADMMHINEIEIDEDEWSTLEELV